LGEIIEAQLITSDLGKIANHYWNEIPLHFPYVKLGEFVVMPNHIHGIIIIDKPDYFDNGGNDGHCRARLIASLKWKRNRDQLKQWDLQEIKIL